MLAVQFAVALASGGLPVRFYLGRDPVREVLARMKANVTGGTLRECQEGPFEAPAEWSVWAWDFVPCPPYPERTDPALFPEPGPCAVVVDDLDLWQADELEIAEQAHRWVERGSGRRIAILTAPQHVARPDDAARWQRWVRAADQIFDVREVDAGETVVTAVTNRRGPRGEIVVDGLYGRARFRDPSSPSRPHPPPSSPTVEEDDLMSGFDWDMPDTSAMALSRTRALAILKSRTTPDDVVRFHDPAGNFAGPTFQDLDPAHDNEVVASDLLAVTLMNVAVQPAAVRRILEDAGNQRRLTEALRTVPANVSLAEADQDVLNSAAGLYQLFKELLRGNKWVTASKLAARKRPALIPVRDRVIVKHLELDNRDFREDWRVMRHLLRDNDVLEALAEVRTLAARQQPVVADLSHLRLLDSALWMHGRSEADEPQDGSGE